MNDTNLFDIFFNGYMLLGFLGMVIFAGIYYFFIRDEYRRQNEKLREENKELKKLVDRAIMQKILK